MHSCRGFFPLNAIANQAAGVQAPARFVPRFGQSLQQVIPLHFTRKDVVAAVCSAHHMTHFPPEADEDALAKAQRGDQKTSPLSCQNPIKPLAIG